MYNQNRNYFITIKVMSLTELITIESVTILVDESPPETGVILEGICIITIETTSSLSKS